MILGQRHVHRATRNSAYYQWHLGCDERTQKPRLCLCQAQPLPIVTLAFSLTTDHNHCYVRGVDQRDSGGVTPSKKRTSTPCICSGSHSVPHRGRSIWFP